MAVELYRAVTARPAEVFLPCLFAVVAVGATITKHIDPLVPEINMQKVAVCRAVSKAFGTTKKSLSSIMLKNGVSTLREVLHSVTYLYAGQVFHGSSDSRTRLTEESTHRHCLRD